MARPFLKSYNQQEGELRVCFRRTLHIYRGSEYWCRKFIELYRHSAYRAWNMCSEHLEEVGREEVS